MLTVFDSVVSIEAQLYYGLRS